MTDFENHLHYKYNFTKKDCDVLRLLSTGMTNQEIADSLGTSLEAIKSNVVKILKRIHCENRYKAIHLYEHEKALFAETKFF